MVIQDPPGDLRRQRQARAAAFEFRALVLHQTLYRYRGPRLPLS